MKSKILVALVAVSILGSSAAVRADDPLDHPSFIFLATTAVTSILSERSSAATSSRDPDEWRQALLQQAVEDIAIYMDTEEAKGLLPSLIAGTRENLAAEMGDAQAAQYPERAIVEMLSVAAADLSGV